MRAAGFSAVNDVVEELDEGGKPRVRLRSWSGRRSTRFTSTQSGSGEGVKGFDGRFGFGRKSLLGGCTREQAGRPRSN